MMADMTRRIAFLKAPDHVTFAADNEGRLPYGIDHLEANGFELVTTEAHRHRPWTSPPIARVVKRIERATTALLQTILLSPSIRRAPLTMAMFESEGHFLALWRDLWSRLPLLLRHRAPRKRMVIIACWLTELCEHASPKTLARYRRLYRNVDRVIVYSSNQPALLAAYLQIPVENISVVPFGIDVRALPGSEVGDDGTVLAVGRDKGRDWPTFLSAVGGSGWPVTLVCRPELLNEGELPIEVTVRPEVDRATYLALLAKCRIVVIPTRELGYPTGQSVLLEAMGLGKPCVVTATEALRDYVSPDETCLVVAPGDPASLRSAMASLMEDEGLRARIGAAARADCASRFDAAVMWKAVAKVLDETLAAGPPSKGEAFAARRNAKGQVSDDVLVETWVGREG